MPTIRVDTGDLARAVKAVLPHADKNDEYPALNRLRFTVAGPNLHVHATDRFTAAVALVSILDHHTGETGQFDLTPGDAVELTRMFKPDKNAIDGEDVLELTWTDTEVTVTDTAGLFEGKAATWPMSVDDCYPDVEAYVGRALRVDWTTPEDDALAAAGAFFKAFATASDVYGATLVLTRCSARSVLVACGESFLGVLSVVPTADGPDDSNLDRRAWRDRLPGEARFQPADVEVRNADDEPADEDPGPVEGPPPARGLRPVPDLGEES